MFISSGDIPLVVNSNLRIPEF